MPRPRFPVATIAARLGIYLLVCWGTLALLIAGVSRGALAALGAVALWTLLPLVVFARWRGWPFYPGKAFRLLVVRPFWYAQLLLPVTAAAGILGTIVGLLFRAPAVAGRWSALFAFTGAAIVLVAGFIGARSLRVRHVEAAIAGLPSAFDGFRIAQLSDVHVGPHTSRRYMRRVVETTRRLAPDVIAVTGDLVDDRAEDVAAYAESLGGLAAPMGVYLIPGNHDVYAGWERVDEALRDASVGTVLVNEAAILRRGSAELAIVGTGDPAGGARGSGGASPDIDRALAPVPRGVTVIALAHNPALWPVLVARRVALTLSGHTHWGQLAIPAHRWSLASPFLEHAMGGHQAGSSLLYISPGTGEWGVPFRLGALPEVTLVTLRSAAEAGIVVHDGASASSVGDADRDSGAHGRHLTGRLEGHDLVGAAPRQDEREA